MSLRQTSEARSSMARLTAGVLGGKVARAWGARRARPELGRAGENSCNGGGEGKVNTTKHHLGPGVPRGMDEALPWGVVRRGDIYFFTFCPPARKGGTLY